MKKTKNEKAITLIALIVTIAALLIVATVSISTIKDDGLLSYAGNQKNDIETEIAKKDNLLNQYGDFLNSNAGSSETGGTTGNGGSTGDNDEEINAGNTITGNTITDSTHTHSFTVKNKSLAYLKSEATCQSPIKYYYSCSCGAKGTNTFTSGKTVSCLAYGDKTLELVATCSSGATYSQRCFWCNSRVYSHDSEYDKNNHGSFGSWQYSCTYNGYKRKYCGCGEYYIIEGLSTEEMIMITHNTETSTTTYRTSVKEYGVFYCFRYRLCLDCGKNICVESHKSVPVGRDLQGGLYMNWYCGTCGTWTGYWSYGSHYN